MVAIGVLWLALLMIVHEAGHFFAARAYGMRVKRFSIGLGPALFKVVPNDGWYWLTAGRVKLRLWRHGPSSGPTEFQIAAIPFGAYVQIAGMNPLEECDPRDKGSYANASLVGRIVTILAGPMANYVFASIIFFASFAIGGRVFRPTEVSVLEGRPAAAADIRDGDLIVEIGGERVSEWDEMAEVIARNPERELAVIIKRGDEHVTTRVVPANEGGLGRIGIKSRAEHRVPVTLRDAAKLSVVLPLKIVREQLIGIGQLLTGKAEGEPIGPIGIVNEGARAAERGWYASMQFLALLSAILGAFNLLPFPALDGGRLVFLGYEAATRRRPNARIEAHVHAIGLLIMLSLIAYVTAKDIGLR